MVMCYVIYKDGAVHRRMLGIISPFFPLWHALNTPVLYKIHLRFPPAPILLLF